jgi:two-component system, chemotaxis family, chemotaxis protein CheY
MEVAQAMVPVVSKMEQPHGGPLVLVIDDEPEIRHLVGTVLEEEGYVVITARDGSEGLRIVAEHQPEVILLDMRMPVMDGWAFARAYRQLSASRAPLVVMTASLDASRWAGEVGAADVLPKPFELDELLSVVGRFTRNPSAVPTGLTT